MIAAFLMLYNEEEKGNLTRCLRNCCKWADEIFIYDDASTDGSRETYKAYVPERNIIFGERNDFVASREHKAQLLDLVLQRNPNWIGWIDGDDILERRLTNDLRKILSEIQHNYNGLVLHNVNLWRSESYYRTDSLFNECFKTNFWRNRGQLQYDIKPGIHLSQHPEGTHPEWAFNYQLLHYGFSSRELMIRKYLDYKNNGQEGWALNRLIDEHDYFAVEKVPTEWYPEENIPEFHKTATPPSRQFFDEVTYFNSYDEYKASRK